MNHLIGEDIDLDRLGAALRELGRGIEERDVGTTNATIRVEMPVDDFVTVELAVEYLIPEEGSELLENPIQFNDIDERFE